jgi:hypothetical protein
VIPSLVSSSADAGYDDDQIERIIKQLETASRTSSSCPAGRNIGKSERLPLDWARDRYPSADALQGYPEQNDMPNLPEGLDGFLVFHEHRRARLRDRLVAILGREPGSLSAD